MSSDRAARSIAVVGAGPGGLYLAISLKLRDPTREIVVHERNRPDDTFGWGVVFSDQTLANLKANDPETAAIIEAAFVHWDDIDVHIHGQTIRSGGHGFAGIGRQRLLTILQDRARSLGVELRFEEEIADIRALPADIIVAADGLNSRIRNENPETFGVDIDVRTNKYIWLGTKQSFDAFTFAFVETPHGWIWAHAYQFEPGASTFIVECTDATWRGLGFDAMDQDQTCRAAEGLFADWLGGQALMSNARHLRGSAWLNFPRVACANWRDGKVVLLGDAAHTAHYSIGSGTKLAFEDAIRLAETLTEADDLDAGLAAYEAERRVEVLKLQSAARNSTEWFETVDRYVSLDPLQFAYSLLTRSQRVSHENLRLRDRDFLTGVERWFAEAAGAPSTDKPSPPMFAPLTLRGLTLPNRVVVSPMCMYSAEDGAVGDFHLVHLGGRALGGAGLVFTEMTNVSADGRITPGCAGMYRPGHRDAWKRIVDFVHAQGAHIAIQLAHAGRKGSVERPWGPRADQPLKEGWPLIAASPIPWSDEDQTPREMTRDDMDRVRDDFVRAARWADEAGFDMVELHCAHGYLLSSFLTPVSNHRTDVYGGSVENRLRFPLEVFDAMRAVWPDDKPMSVRLSATDWVEDGLTPEDSVAIARAFANAGCDLIDVSAGQTSEQAQPVYGRMFQTPFSDRIRNEAGVATMAVGNIYEPDHVNSILAAGRADLCALARPHLADPNWSLRAAAELGWRGQSPPVQYLAGFAQLARNLEKQQQAGPV
ncbi:MAG: bifunctional salicylyl-CoA 5-hydroxylase/oxidoreductase [Alphaproteobacteria bacterium]|jgi:anthraniloyl-CoA monooxygenase|nr:bifunctional salicylyl-CoA 5-hydroxylase/oxidoreductase [Alphaproteobacteria bacterium]MBU2040976.1 bifunctional salicylyl-CoA 5-hydroxylase/oxidoreductase [Alphaproteobacteria bacterium]MBU2126210.1 bifunctional salicylyl-CoA 5-hydroxylase/oxidoreductase [Alphaproteobacteria bacterium]MBU2207559.1 bifunctional salicylyl-CoA 5-hydroxylase/oxidoreductase [Alphaproteobacteria bacterium]MBU2291506.1 bifunctional salicylyl-CoA 5-hydroxylase/oxidoreductase [Alphaproteobacteria bacterium]